MEDNNGSGFFTESPLMAWDPFLDPNIPPLDLDSNFGLDNAAFPSLSNDNGLENWLQEANVGSEQPDLTTRHGHTRALSASAIPPEINIDFAPPSRTQHDDQVNGAVASWSGDWYQSPSLLPFDMRRRPRSPSPARSITSTGRMRSSSTGSIQPDYFLDLAKPYQPGASQSTTRARKPGFTFQCTLCPKKFTRAYNLRSHLRTHTDERPFACTVCGKAFARQQDRKRHEGLHSGEKKFVCRGLLADFTAWGCGRRFARAEALSRHIRSEAGQACIRPLVDEEGELHGAPNVTLDPRGLFPARLLAQYPILASVRPDDPSYNPSPSPLSRSNSFGASSFGSTGLGYDGNGFGYEHSVSRQVSDASLHSAYSATSFSSQRGTRILGGYECNQCGLAFDVPSDLRHHERNHMSKEQRPHACEHCGERFLYPKDVQRHIGRKHPGEHSSPLLDQASAMMPEPPNSSPRLEPPGLGPDLMDLFMLHRDPDPPPFPSNTATSQGQPSEVERPHQEHTADQANGSTLPRSKSTEILHLKQALETAIYDAKLWREERNFYAELLQESIPHTDLDLALRFVHKDEVVPPVRRARGWLGGIWSLLRARRASEYEDENHRTASRAVTALAAQLKEMDVTGNSSVEGRRKSGSREGSRASSPIRAKWKEFEGWVAGT